MADATGHALPPPEGLDDARRPDRACHDRQRRRLAQAEHLRRGRARFALRGPRRARARATGAGWCSPASPSSSQRAPTSRSSRGSRPSSPARAVRRGTSSSAALRELPFPTLAALNGAALGGGLEIALHCDVRTVASNVRHLGFPEVFLGLFPAWGGTQLTPRLVGAEAAVRLIVDNPLEQNRLIRAADALELGLADHVLEPVEFLDESIELLAPADRGGRGQARAGGRPGRRLGGRPQGARPGRRRRPRAGARAVPGARPDRGRCVVEPRGGLRRGGGRSRGAAARARGAGVDLRVRRRRAAHQEAWRGIPEAQPRRVQAVGVVGAGLMATQLATLFLRRLEVPVVLTDVDAERARRRPSRSAASSPGSSRRAGSPRARPGSSARS